jgi:hypothetical protein
VSSAAEHFTDPDVELDIDRDLACEYRTGALDGDPFLAIAAQHHVDFRTVNSIRWNFTDVD